uniref:Transmembrane protein 106A n=1 Tax=Pseudonaja textilis TaxID=8673 RepID=A0A670ZNB6_PSETE
MDKAPLWFKNMFTRKETEESKSIMQKNSCAENKTSCYGSINGADASEVSCVPCGNHTSRGFVTCPTCQGTGRIPREQEQQLVALIPYGDQRLKPRRTKLYVFLTVAICLLTTCLMMYFLFPRSIAVVPSGLNASTISFDNSTSSIILNMTNILNVTNNNFYPVYVAQLDIEVFHKTVVIGKKMVMTQLDIRPLQSAQILYKVTRRYHICKHFLITKFLFFSPTRGTLTCSYLSHSEQLSFENYQYVDCRDSVLLEIAVACF